MICRSIFFGLMLGWLAVGLGDSMFGPSIPGWIGQSVTFVAVMVTSMQLWKGLERSIRALGYLIRSEHGSARSA